MTIASRGRLCLNVAYAPTYRLDRSSSYFFEPCVAPTIDASVARLIAHTGYHGQISFDWFVDAQGRATMIECNPRAVSGLHLLADDDAVCTAMLEGGRTEVDATALRPRMLAAIMLAAGLPQAVAKGELRRWWHDWRRADDVLAQPGDRRPPLGALRDLCAYATLSLRDRCSIREASTRDIEWDGETLPDVRSQLS